MKFKILSGDFRFGYILQMEENNNWYDVEYFSLSEFDKAKHTYDNLTNKSNFRLIKIEVFLN